MPEEITRNEKETAFNNKDKVWEFRLYVAGQTPTSGAAYANLSKICEDWLNGRYKIEVIDLLDNPDIANADRIIAAPTLIKMMPLPSKRIIGDLSNTQRVLDFLNISSQG